MWKPDSGRAHSPGRVRQSIKAKLKGVGMEKHVSFQDYAIVACGTLNMELNHLKDSGSLDARKILYTRQKYILRICEHSEGCWLK